MVPQGFLPGLRWWNGGSLSMKRATRKIGDTHRDQHWETVRTHQRRIPGEDAAPVVADKNRLLFTEHVEHAHQVSDEVQQRIRFDSIGLVGLAVSSQVEGDDVVASFGQRGELVPPGIPKLREAVAEKHEGAGSLLGDVYTQAIGVDKSM